MSAGVMVRINDMFAGDLQGRDISSCQTQVLAAFLGVPELEEQAGSVSPKFKVWLARQLWDLHKREGVLAAGYDDGPEDSKLINFVKENWMRYTYGSRRATIALDLSKPQNRQEYGPGWNGGAAAAERHWRRFFGSLPAWAGLVAQFLDVCRDIGRRADLEYGIVFNDPLDGASIRWNPIQRATDHVTTGKRRILVRRPGVMRKRRRNNQKEVQRFVWRDPHVDTRKLANRVAPCLVHTMDAYFNALVLQRLYKAGLTNVVAIHDSWFAPLVIYHPDGGAVSVGESVLEDAIHNAGREWLEGIGGICGWLADATLGTPHQGFARDVRKRWRQRVASGAWPRFTAVPE